MTVRATILAAAVAAAAVLIVSACGNAGAAGSPTLGGGASLAPADSVAFVAVDTNLSSGQWSSVNDLLAKFPSHDELVTQLRQSFEQKTKLSWENDVKPALGDELDLVVLPGTKKQAVALTQNSDQAKLDALATKLKCVQATLSDGWTALAEDQATLDALKGATTKLSADATYTAATAKLSGATLAEAYANGAEAQKLVDAANPNTQKTVPFAWASAQLAASDGGVQLDVYTKDAPPAVNRPPATTAPYSSTLVDEIPSGALGVADFVFTPELLQGVSSDISTDLDALLGGETALYVRRGVLLPEVTLVTQPADTQAALKALDDLQQKVGSQGTGKSILSQFHLVHDVIGGQLVVSTSPQGIADFRSNGSKLSGDSAFKDAGIPDKTTGFVWVDTKDTLPFVQAFAPLLGIKLPASLQGNLSALRTVTAYGSRSGDESHYFVQLQIG
jgi:hypothetical protein